MYKNGDFNCECPAQHSLTATTFYNVYAECISLYQTTVPAKQGLQQQGDSVLFNDNFSCDSNTKYKKVFWYYKLYIGIRKMNRCDGIMMKRWRDRRDRRYGDSRSIDCYYIIMVD